VIANQCAHCDSLRAALRAVARLHGACGRSWCGNPFSKMFRFLLKVRLKPQVLGDADCHVAAFWAAPRNDILVSILF
ncbi:MAG: hypothetical protein IKC09_10695, partial [Oscillospiraceae bacterium]|nr:hypothetical protein [Oscillospiraceae bacterium]